MEKKTNLLFGIIGGLFLVSLRLPLFSLSIISGGMIGYIVWNIIRVLSFIGLIFIIYFSILLIVDTIKTIHRK